MPFCTKQTHIFLHWGKQQQRNLPLIIFLSVFYLIFVCKLFSPGELQWLFPPMEISKLQHPTKSFLWRSDGGLIPEKSKAEVYLGSMESKHTTRFTRKKRAKKIDRFVFILTDFGIGSLVIIIYIGHYFLPIAYVIFIIWGKCNLKRSRRTVIFLPVYKISSLKITPPKTPNSGQFSYLLPNIVSFLFRFRSRDFSFNLFPVWQPYCWRFWSAIVPIHTSTINAPKRERIIDTTSSACGKTNNYYAVLKMQHF